MQKGDVCVVNLSDGFGHEQGGVRPGLVLATTDTSIVVVIPLLPTKKHCVFLIHCCFAPRSKMGWRTIRSPSFSMFAPLMRGE